MAASFQLSSESLSVNRKPFKRVVKGILVSRELPIFVLVKWKIFVSWNMIYMPSCEPWLPYFLSGNENLFEAGRTKTGRVAVTSTEKCEREDEQCFGCRPRNKSGRYAGHYDRWITKFTGDSGIYAGHCHSLASFFSSSFAWLVALETIVYFELYICIQSRSMAFIKAVVVITAQFTHKYFVFGRWQTEQLFAMLACLLALHVHPTYEMPIFVVFFSYCPFCHSICLHVCNLS